ncbi:DUF1269 domain-containing protein [Bordetella holmesii]|uniref:DUF1269 domain-containing protein n=1 Tax=Bordetella holmesii TaxID=35814 RepID=UPI001D150AD8|nr:DUF1269 domain-containing protein [Bordetella holmesii]UEB21037.1 DUF1269 domain-containing protein [Bordetella holmesii]
MIAVTWEDESRAYKAFTELSSSPPVTINQMAVVQRDLSGHIAVREGANSIFGAAAAGSVLGAAVGILAGPVGLLLGFSGGALFGSLVDADAAASNDLLLASLSSNIKPGTTALIADVEEIDATLLDAYAKTAGGQILRVRYDELFDEVASAVTAAEAAADAAGAAIRAGKKAERKAEREKTWDAVKAKLEKFFSSSRA